MSHSKPFHRNYRGFIKSPNFRYSQWAFVLDRDYSEYPEHYTRAFLLIQSDLQKLFEYVEPSDINLNTYSFRIHELFVRTCIEIEANFKAILKENIYNPTDRKNNPIQEKNWNINNYRIVNKTHHLSSYKVYIPIWEGTKSVYEPYKQWATTKELTWYQAYNKSKHDRKTLFKEANFANLLNAVTGLVALLSSQFGTQDFSPGSILLSSDNSDSYYSTEPGLGDFFHIEFPNDWSEEEKYDFDWTELKKENDRFEKIDYDQILKTRIV